MTTHLEKAWMTESEKLFCGSNCLRKGDLRTNGKAPSHIVDDQGHFGTILQTSGLNYFQSEVSSKGLRFWYTGHFSVSFAFFNLAIQLENQVFDKTKYILHIRYSSWLFNFKFLKLTFDIVFGLFWVFRISRALF